MCKSGPHSVSSSYTVWTSFVLRSTLRMLHKITHTHTPHTSLQFLVPCVSTCICSFLLLWNDVQLQPKLLDQLEFCLAVFYTTFLHRGIYERLPDLWGLSWGRSELTDRNVELYTQFFLELITTQLRFYMVSPQLSLLRTLLATILCVWEILSGSNNCVYMYRIESPHWFWSRPMTRNGRLFVFGPSPNKGSWRILKDLYCSVIMLRELGLNVL